MFAYDYEYSALQLILHFSLGSFAFERVRGLSYSAFGQVMITLCQKHTTRPHNLCSHKLPDQPLLSGTIPGSKGTCFLPLAIPPTHALRGSEPGWETDS